MEFGGEKAKPLLFASWCKCTGRHGVDLCACTKRADFGESGCLIGFLLKTEKESSVHTTSTQIIKVPLPQG
ncbi:hypothetical protein XENTR_v10016213 [Xenopus tropicalis]|nr:hypothetical protein XENTR_v10016213 [Xenopus tropicalis]